MNKPLTASEIDANPSVIRHPDAYQKKRNRSGQKGGASKIYLDFPWAWRAIEMLDSPAYMVLSLTARRIMDALESELGRHKGNPMKNGELICRYEDLCRRGIDRNAIGPAIRELVALGFVRITRQGAAGNADYKQATLYLLTYRHAGSNAILEDGWRRIQTMVEAEQIAAAARQRKTRSKASEFGRKGAAARWGKNKNPVMETIPTPVMETIPRAAKKAVANPHFPVMETIPLYRVSRGSPSSFPPPVNPPRAVRQERFYTPPRRSTGQIRPKPVEMRQAVAADALADLERLLRRSPLTDGAAGSARSLEGVR